MKSDLNENKIGSCVYCRVCHCMKAPRGRSVPYQAHYCTRECSGWDLDPRVGDLWPGESEADFGYPCSDVGIEIKTGGAE